MNEPFYHDVDLLDIPAPVEPERLIDGAMRNINAGRAAHELLREIDAGTARPDDLANRLLELIVGTDDKHRADVVRGFCRPFEKRIERQSGGSTE